MEIIDFYGSLLRAVGCSVLENSEIHRNYFGELSPIRVSGKQLVLPTTDILKAGDWNGKIAFHPVCESATRSESAVFKELRNMMSMRASQVIADLLMQLMSIAVNKEMHPKLSADQAQFLTQIPHDVNENTLTKLTSVINATSPKSEHRLITMFPKRAGKLDGVEYRRVAVVEFPILAAKAAEELRIFGVAMGTKRDKNAVIKLMEYLFPDAESKEYCAGSQDLSAPGFLALCSAYSKVMSRLNYVVQLFKDYLEDADDLITEMAWVDGLTLVDRYRAAIPPLSGNDGDPIPDNAASGNVVQATGNVVQPAPMVAPVQQSVAQTPTLQRPEKKYSFADMIAPIGSTGGTKDTAPEQGVVYKEEPPVALNQYGQIPRMNAPAMNAPVNAFMQAPAAPAGWPANSGYVPGVAAPINAYSAPAPAVNAFGQAPVQQAPQLVDASHLVGQFPVPPQFRLAMEMATQQLVVISPQGQPLGYYNVVMPQIIASMQQQPGFAPPAPYGAPAAFPAPNQGFAQPQQGFVGRTAATQMLQQNDYNRALMAQQQNQWSYNGRR